MLIPGIAASIPLVEPDPFYLAVALLVRSVNVTNGQTTFLDESNAARTLTRGGQTIYSNAQTKFDSNPTMLFDGSGNDWISVPDHPDLGLEDRTKEFCLEAWFWPDDVVNTNSIFVGRDGNFSEEFTLSATAATATFILWDAGPHVILTAGGVITQQVWNHIAITRTLNGSDGDLVMYINGVSAATVTQTVNTFTNNGDYFIGHNEYRNERDMTGHIDSLRLTINNPRYTGNFTAPTVPFPNF